MLLSDTLCRFWLFAAFLRPCEVQLTPAPIVELDYAQYQGYYDAAVDQNIYRGHIRYAAPPVGELRWQLPQAPSGDSSEITQAVEYASQCPQAVNSPGPAKDSPSGDEDCLFLNVMAPANRRKLPVLVWIHGGGYIQGNSQYDLTQQIKTNDNAYIAVSITYRLGAFGFLSSAEFAESGVPNAGIHDMRFALEWVQKHIHHFGGDPERVTIAGESAGGGAVMLLAMANGGTESSSLFKGVISSSTYLPTQWDFDGDWPSAAYHAFTAKVGCSANEDESILDCLRAADTDTLKAANADVSASVLWGQSAFIPVTDGVLIEQRPSEQLHVDGKVNGVRVLSGNNLNEGVIFVPQNVTSEEDFRSFVLTNYPLLSAKNLTNILELYAVPDDSSDILVDSSGVNPPYSTTNSQWAVGWQQAVTNLYAETTFVCPSYWLADGFAKNNGTKAWKYQFSVPPAQHGADVEPFLSDPTVEGTGTDEVFRTAFQRIWGNFIVKGDPTLNTAQTSAPDGGNISAAGTGLWPQWGGKPGEDKLLNLNMTGGMPVTSSMVLDGVTVQVTSYVSADDGSSPPLEAEFKLVPGWSWEDGRGKRCQLWADLGPWIME